MTPEDYNIDFFKLQHNESYISAKEILPLVLDLTHPESILDVGCGSGAWLKAYEELTNSNRYKGIDGDYVDSSSLIISNEHFITKNLEAEFDLQERFDLVLSLEVAEHLHEEYATTFVKSLTMHSDIVLFSAAIPGQEGTRHYNEQFPEYWEKIFNSCGYVCKDIIRDKIWDNKNISFWYKQNVLIYIKESKLSSYPTISDLPNYLSTSLTRIHPELWVYKNRKLEYFENIAKSLKRFVVYKYLRRRWYK
jgi:SAM-dependent methyltransferase